MVAVVAARHPSYTSINDCKSEKLMCIDDDDRITIYSNYLLTFPKPFLLNHSYNWIQTFMSITCCPSFTKVSFLSIHFNKDFEYHQSFTAIVIHGFTWQSYQMLMCWNKIYVENTRRKDALVTILDLYCCKSRHCWVLASEFCPLSWWADANMSGTEVL
jgi:hypothetical protein